MKNLITDQNTDMVFFSKYIKDKSAWKPLEEVMQKYNVKYGFITPTKDIWVRDFMPIQISEDKFVQYVYDPDYLKDEPQYRTDVDKCVSNMKIKTVKTDIILDGGNVIKCDDAIIMTDKIFSENRIFTKLQLINEIEKLFESELILIPWDKEEICGHSDGMVRFVDNNKVIINNYCDFDAPLRKKMIKALSPKFEIQELHYDAKSWNENSWIYINFLQIGRAHV